MTHHDEQEIPEVKIERVEGEAESAGSARLGAEFREFGRQLLRAVRSVAESEELRHLGQEIVESLRDIGEEVQTTLERTREKDEVRAVGEQARRVGQSVSSNLRGGEVTGDVQTNLSQALNSLNNELNKVIDQIQSRSARVSNEVEGSASDAEGAEQKERFEKSMDEALHEAQDESSKGKDPIDEGAQDLEDAWEEPTQPEADVDDGKSQ